MAGMRSSFDPFRFLAAATAGWVNQHQQNATEYLREGNRVLRQQWVAGGGLQQEQKFSAGKPSMALQLS